MLLHHIGIAVKDIHKANKEYLLRPGFRQASNIIHDKIQTAKVMFLQVARDRVLWELVMPDSADSILKGAINKGGGLIISVMKFQILKHIVKNYVIQVCCFCTLQLKLRLFQIAV